MVSLACEVPEPSSGVTVHGLKVAQTDTLNRPSLGYYVLATRDISAAREVGVRPVLVRTGNGAATERKLPAAELPVEPYPFPPLTLEFAHVGFTPCHGVKILHGEGDLTTAFPIEQRPLHLGQWPLIDVDRMDVLLSEF